MKNKRKLNAQCRLLQNNKNTDDSVAFTWHFVFRFCFVTWPCQSITSIVTCDKYSPLPNLRYCTFPLKTTPNADSTRWHSCDSLYFCFFSWLDHVNLLHQLPHVTSTVPFLTYDIAQTGPQKPTFHDTVLHLLLNIVTFNTSPQIST